MHRSIEQLFNERFSQPTSPKAISLVEISSLTEFEKGVSDCKAGKPHAVGYPQSEAYTQGYAEQYAKEQEDEFR